MKRFILLLSVLALALPLQGARRTELHIVTTGDVHGRYFSRPYVEGERDRMSLQNVKYYVDSLRAAVGPENVILLDAGDILQGDNASYYFNYVATDVPHIYPRIAAYMGYDACTVGNHDIETGHPVYDRVNAQLASYGIPWLGGNALRPDGSPYFREYTLLNKGGRRVLVVGFNNANIDGWLSEPLWSGMRHVSLLPFVQQRVDELRARLDPDVVIVTVHSATGKGDGSSLEAQGLDLYNTLHGVDVLVCAHDHRPAVHVKNDLVLINGGDRCARVGHAVLEFHGPRLLSRRGETVRLHPAQRDREMEREFEPEWQAVRDFTLQPVGELGMPLVTRDAYTGMSDYINLIHTVQLRASGAQISLAAPLTFNGTVRQGEVIFNDMFTIYPFENQLYVLKMTGAEVKALLEYSYGRWIQTPGDHVLMIADRSDPRTRAARWSFVNRSYNFDSAAGLVYEVDVTRPLGERVNIFSMADGSAFDPDATYSVAMTSYRANGGGALLTEGAGIPSRELEGRIEVQYPEIRDLIYAFIKENGTVTPESVSDASLLGHWQFVPREIVEPLLLSDMSLVF